MVYGAALEKPWVSQPRGFESHSLRSSPGAGASRPPGRLPSPPDPTPIVRLACIFLLACALPRQYELSLLQIRQGIEVELLDRLFNTVEGIEVAHQGERLFDLFTVVVFETEVDAGQESSSPPEGRF